MANKMQGNSPTDYLMEDTVKATGMEGEQPEDGAQGAPSGKAEVTRVFIALCEELGTESSIHKVAFQVFEAAGM